MVLFWAARSKAQTVSPVVGPINFERVDYELESPLISFNDTWSSMFPELDNQDSDVINLNNRNLKAFLAMIRFAEGTERYGNDAHRVRFGGELVVDGLSNHPGDVVCRMSNGKRICSSAVGAYQFLKRTWDWIGADLPDFGRQSQDIAAARLIRYRGALGDVYQGKFDKAVKKCAKEWASLPSAGYGQPEKSLAELQRVYENAGGLA